MVALVFTLVWSRVLRTASAADAQLPLDADVIIVGAGFTGLTAAVELNRSNLSVLLLEASSRVGGRSLDHRFDDGSVCEEGLMVFGDRKHNPHTHELFVDQFNLTLFNAWH